MGLTVVGALAGLLVGSFIGALVTRWPLSVLAGRSRCDACGRAIPAARLIPGLSFGLQGGRAHCCGASIDPLHLVAELGGAAVGIASVACFGTQGWGAALLGWQLLALGLVDARTLKLPNVQNALLAVTGLATTVLLAPDQLAERLIGMAAGFLALEVLRRTYSRLRGQEGIGGGDPKLVGALGAWLGWQQLPMLLLSAALAGLAAAVLLAVLRRSPPSGRLPLGLFLALAGLPLYLLAGGP